MPLVDWSLDKLREYRPELDEQEDFDAFWASTLEEVRSHPLDATFTVVEDTGLPLLDVFDVRFNGFGGDPIAAWLLLPRHRSAPLPVVIKYIGYSGGRGEPHEHLVMPSAGYAHLVVDTRGMGTITPDRDPGITASQHYGGMMTKGITDPTQHFYRRAISDCVRAVEAARAHPDIDSEKVIVAGGSQGGGLTLAVAGLVGDLAAAMPDVPFLTGYRRATEIASKGPYLEIVDYLRKHRHDEEIAFRTMSYFDGVNFAARANAPVLFSVGLMDPVCPPSTVYAAFNHYGAEDKEITIWPWNEHDGGGPHQVREQLTWLAKRFSA